MLTLKKIFKTYLLAGTLVLVPIIGTFLILRLIIEWSDALIRSLLPASVHPDSFFGMHIPGLGLLWTLIIILVVGSITHLYVGKKAVELGDRLIGKIPFGRGIYNGMKQLTNTLFHRDQSKFRSVVAVEYPRKGLWMLGFVTSDSSGEIKNIDMRPMVNIFIPTTPNPTSGFLVIVPKEDVKFLSMTVEEAFKFIISGGIIHGKNEACSRNQEV